MDTAGTAAVTDQAGVNAAPSFDSAAESLLGLDSSAQVQQDQAQGAAGTQLETGKLDTGDKGSAAEGAAQADQGAAGAAAQKSEEQKAAAEAQVDEWAVDQALLDKLLADPTHGAFAKQLYEKYQKLGGYREHWSLEEAREARALAPGGIEELRGIVQAGKDARAENAEFATGDPARQATVLKSIAQDMPEAYAAGAKPYLETLREVAPETYQKVGLEIAREALQADGLPETINALLEAAAKEDEKSFAEAFGKLSEWTEKAGFRGKGEAAKQQASPELQRALEENRQLRESQQRETAQKFTDWKRGVDEGFQKSLGEEVGKNVESVLPKNMPTAAREQLGKRLTREILAEIDDRLAKDTELGEKMLAAIGNDAWRKNPQQSTEQARNLLFGRAKQILPYVARDVLNPFTEAAVASAQQKAEKENTAASRQDVRGGNSAGAPKRPLSVEDMKGRGYGKQLSDEQILDM